MLSLNDAIQLIRQGRKEEARQALEPLIRAEPANITAWFWYVEVCSTLEKRIQVLEVCLKMNPGNPQVIQALQTLRNKQPSQASFTPPHVQPPKPVVSQPLQPALQYSAAYDEELNSPIYFDDSPTYLPELSNTTQEQFPGKKKKTWDEDYTAYEDTSMLSKSKPAAKSYSFFDAWIKVLTTMDIESYESVLDDPEAGAGRAFEWVAYAGIISGLIFPLSIFVNPQFSQLRNMPEFNKLFGTMGITAFVGILALVMLVLTPINSVIGLAISAGIQNLLAGFFGGKGYFGRTAYALAAYTAPITILLTALSIIPLVGQCLSSLLGFYSIVLNVRALRAAHSISIGQALGVMFTPILILLIFMCVLILAVGMPGLSKLK